MAKIRKQLTRLESRRTIFHDDFTDLPTRRKCKLPFAINAAVHRTRIRSLLHTSPSPPFPFVSPRPSFLLPFRVPGTLYVSHPCLEVIPSFLLPTAISPNNMAAKRSEQSIASELVGANWLYNRIKTIKREIERHLPTVLRDARTTRRAIDLCPTDYGKPIAFSLQMGPKSNY